MDANQLFVTNWAKKYCPQFLSILPPETEFVSFTVGESVERHTQVFMRSTFPTWEEHPMYSSLLEACTDEGRKFFDDMLRAKTYSVVTSTAGVIFGSVNGAAALKSNLADTGSALKRLEAKLPASFDSALRQPLYDLYGTRQTMDVFMGLEAVKVTLAALRAAGMTDIQGPFLSEEAIKPPSGGARIRAGLVGTEVINKCGPSRFPVHFMTDPAGTGTFGASNYGDVIALPFFYTVGMTDDSISELAPRGGSVIVFSKNQVGPSTLYVNRSQLTGDFIALYDFIGKLNPAFLPETPGQTFGVARIDSHWLPLCVLPGKHELLVRAAPTNVTIRKGDDDGLRMQTITVASPDVVGIMPVAWYIDYANGQIAKGATNKAELQQAVKDMTDYQSKSITFIAYAKPVFLEENLVLLTQLYRDYKKAREKACEDDVFLTLKFTNEMTYGQLNTLINGSRSTRVFFGYRDSAEQVSFSDPMPSDYTGWVFTGGAAVVTARRPDGTFAPSYTKDTGEELIQALASGGRLVGATLAEQLSIWGFDATLIAAQEQGLSQSYANVKQGLVKASPTAYYDFRWESVGLTGVPDIAQMSGDVRFRAVMVSKGAVSPLGTHMRDILMEEIISFYGSTVQYVTPKIK